ncbi:MAG TPA: alpha/beta fold hydrolase [Acetobacteraceae bacterium]
MILHAIDTGHGLPLVLLHGLFGAARNFGTVQRELAAHHHVIALDLRNHGASPHAAGMSYADMAADVLETLTRLGTGPVALLGHSMGGKVAMRLALEHPDAIACLLIADIAPVPYEPHHRAFAAAMLSLPNSLSRAQANAALERDVPDPIIRGFLLQNFTPGATPPWRIGLQQIADALPEIEAWDDLTPRQYTGLTLVLAGETSDYIRPQHRPLIRALFPAARFVTIRNAGHWLHADNPTVFVAVIEAFLARTTQTEGPPSC